MDKSKYTILIVDDVKDNRTIVEKILFKAGYKTKTAESGVNALTIIESEDIDLILLDIMMPGISGLEVCRHLKIEPATASIPVIFLTASHDNEMLSKAYKVGGVDYIRKPFFRDELLARVNVNLTIRDYDKTLEYKIAEKTKEISKTQVELMYTLGGIAEGHSIETQNHVKRVSQFTYLLARLYGLDNKEALRLRDASSLHDIGKIGVTDSILHKAGVLTNAEFKIMKTHVTLGAEILQTSNLPLFKVAKIVAEEHHEKWNGSGYPKKLKGDNIHLYGRIVAIADVFDALSFRRAYKESWSTEDVISYMKEMRGKHFDPQLIDIFLKNIDKFLRIYSINLEKVELDKKFNKQKKGKIMDWLFKNI